MFLGTRTTHSQWETGSDPGGTLREGPPPSPPPGLWRRRSLKRRSPSPVFSPLGRGIYFDAHISLLRLKMALGLLSTYDVWWVTQLLFCFSVSGLIPDFPAEEKQRCQLLSQSQVRPDRSLQMQRPFPQTCFLVGRAVQRCIKTDFLKNLFIYFFYR